MTTTTYHTETIDDMQTTEQTEPRAGQGLVRLLRAMLTQQVEETQDPERAERRRVARRYAAYPAMRGVGMTATYRDAPR
ncbi:hypothetical protein MWU75_10120 [Ornithinimicrobium sp. F0845]|uniref:hypothetical protein n=1 Tax=Ornithinimicrobium sp. F0845 TaxID=2926412 RepID=UPI001FF18528|nr:hypothetical protein [Ornithinimicrobium sp. F0845]MCK0112493.1 hypothetical protein [Ornithinimicrobium sp. F0845]